MSTYRGSCLCKSVTFEVTGPISGVGSCHCSKCRKVSGTAGNAQFIVRMHRFRWTAGQDRVTTFTLPGGCTNEHNVATNEHKYISLFTSLNM